jgi:outer membrane protein assembly factor BamB
MKNRKNKIMNNRKALVIITLVLIAGLFSGCTAGAGTASSWPGISSDGEMGYFAYGAEVYAIDAKNGTLVWRYPANPDAKTQFFAAPAVSEDQVIAGSYNNTLVAIDKNNGSEKWTFVSAKDRYIASPLVIGDKVFAPNTDKHLYALNTAGDLLWSFKTTGPNWTKPVSDEQFVYLASMDHFLYALNLDYSNSALAVDTTGSRTLVEKPVWSVDLGTAVVADPVLSNGSVLVATIDGKLHSINTATGKIAWTFEDGDRYNSIWGSPVVTEEAVYFGNENGEIFAVSPETGKALWPAPYAAGGEMIAGGIAIDGGVMFVNQQGKVFSINAAKEPKPVVTLDTVIYATPKVAGANILFAPVTKEKLFMALDLSGNEVWSFTPSK